MATRRLHRAPTLPSLALLCVFLPSLLLPGRLVYLQPGGSALLSPVEGRLDVSQSGMPRIARCRLNTHLCNGRTPSTKVRRRSTSEGEIVHQLSLWLLGRAPWDASLPAAQVVAPPTPPPRA